MCWPSFIIYPNGIVLRLFNKRQPLKTTKLSSSIAALKEPNGNVLPNFTQKEVMTQQDELQKTPASTVTKSTLGIFSSTPTPSSLIELKQRVYRIVVKQSTQSKSPSSSSSSLMVKKKMEIKTDQRDKQLFGMSTLLVTKKFLGTFSLTLTLLSLKKLKQRAHQTVVKQNTVLRTSALLIMKKSSGIVPLKDLVGKSEKICLPRFISHSNGIVLRVFKRQRSRISSSSSEPTFICHPNGIVLKVLIQKRSRKSPFCAVVST